MNGEENDERKRLFILGDGISVDMLYAFLVYRPHSGDGDIVKESIMQPTFFIVWIVPVLTYLKQSGMRGAHRQKLFKDSLTSDVSDVEISSMDMFIASCRFVSLKSSNNNLKLEGNN